MDIAVQLEEQLDVKALLHVLMALKKGDFSARMPADLTGMPGKVADTLNEIIESNELLAKGIADVSRDVGREGRLSQRAAIPSVTGGWAKIVIYLLRLLLDFVREF